MLTFLVTGLAVMLCKFTLPYVADFGAAGKF